MLDAWYLNIIGLGLSICGTLFLFFGAPEYLSALDIWGSLRSIQSIDPVGDSQRKIEHAKYLSRVGLSLIMAGFVAQGISTLLQYPR